MRNIFEKDQILTIPNLLSLVRLALIPVIIWLYCVKQEYRLAVIIVILSGLTDIADGFIARHFNMVSDFGKILDPVADKLTQTAMLFCLATRYKRMKYLICLFAVKELFMCISGLFVIRKTDKVDGAVWYGKANTMLLYLIMGLLILMPNMDIRYVNMLIHLSGISIVLTMAGYIAHYAGILKNHK